MIAQSYKGVRLDEAQLYELSDFMRIKHHLADIVFSLKMDDDFTKGDAARELLDVITEDLDCGFHNEAAEQQIFKLYQENAVLKKRLNELKS